MYRTLVILRHTFWESIVQPIYGLILLLGAAVLITFAALPFFTLGEDTVMFMSVGLDIILLLVLVATLFATSKSIFDEIEDRTMLTLMSKPVAKWQVMIGKYLGIILGALLAVAALGAVLAICIWLRVPGDYQINLNTIDDRELTNALEHRLMHLAGLVPSLLLLWMQISVLAALGVAISTRLPLVVNLPLVVMLYVAGNLSRFLFPVDGQSPLIKSVAYVLATVLPYLEIFDLRPLTVHSRIALAGTQFAEDFHAVPALVIWRYCGVAALYAVLYASFALSAGMWLFQNRELGGGEG